jgi:hypothetical protein
MSGQPAGSCPRSLRCLKQLARQVTDGVGCNSITSASTSTI